MADVRPAAPATPGDPMPPPALAAPAEVTAAIDRVLAMLCRHETAALAADRPGDHLFRYARTADHLRRARRAADWMVPPPPEAPGG